MKSQAERRVRIRRLVAVAGAAALLGAAACAAKVADKAPEEEATAQELGEHHGKRWLGPVGHVIEAAREHASLTQDQRASLDAIERDLQDNSQSRRALGEKLRTTAVTVVRSGRADSPEFDQSVNEAVRAFEARVKQNTDALEEIHAILTPEQRQAVAVVLHDKIDKKFGKRRDHAKRRQEGFQRFAAHLMLSTLQIDKLEAMKKELFSDHHRLRPSQEELHQLVDAFEGEDFGTALNEFHAERTRMVRARLAKAGSRTDTVLAVFTPQQRELLADMIQEGPRKVLFGEKAERPAPER